MNLFLVHGWGFDAGLWDPVAERLAGHAIVRSEAGYFGAPAAFAPAEPYVAVSHSMGAMQVLGDDSGLCRGLVAINGFDRFTARESSPGVAPRVVERMLARFEQDPDAVLAEFRKRCGSEEPAPPPKSGPLLADLRHLRDGDCSAATSRFARPILSLQGARDAILPPAMRAATFASAPHIERESHPAHGHLLPIEDPDYCAGHIRSFLERLS